MTKTKKKMTKSTFVIIIMAVAMVAMLAFGGTFAYFTATTTEKSGTVTTGTVQLAANGMATLVADKVVSGQELFKSGTVTVTSKSNVDTFVFITFSATMDGGTRVYSLGEVNAEGKYYLDIDQATEWAEVPGHEGEGVLYRRVAANTADPMDVCAGIKFYGMSASTESTVGTIMNKTITVTITSEAIQVIGEDDATEMTPQEAYEVLNPGVGG